MTFLKSFFLIVILLAAALFAFVKFHPVFGGVPDSASQARIAQSKAFNGKQFENLEPTPLMVGEPVSKSEALLKFLFRDNSKNPTEPLPTVKLDVSALKDNSAVWFGHSTVLFQMGGKRMITDPVYHYASPVPFLVGKPFEMSNTPTIAELPELDAVLISHDHYDHLDYKAIQEIDAKTKHFFVPLGVKAHLQRWGIADEKITELDWHEQAKVGDVQLTYVPARHFSGRTLGAENPSLWGGYVIKSPDFSLYYSADSGYGKHFKEQIAQYGEFDFVMIENGAYNEKWALIHEMPEEAVRAVLDINSKRVMPIHWGKFDLSEHHWKEPVERFTQAAEKSGLDVATPRIGQVFDMQADLPKEKWWQSVK